MLFAMSLDNDACLGSFLPSIVFEYLEWMQELTKQDMLHCSQIKESCKVFVPLNYMLDLICC